MPGSLPHASHEYVFVLSSMHREFPIQLVSQFRFSEKLYFCTCINVVHFENFRFFERFWTAGARGSSVFLFLFLQWRELAGVRGRLLFADLHKVNSGGSSRELAGACGSLCVIAFSNYRKYECEVVFEFFSVFEIFQRFLSFSAFLEHGIFMSFFTEHEVQEVGGVSFNF